MGYSKELFLQFRQEESFKETQRVSDELYFQADPAPSKHKITKPNTKSIKTNGTSTIQN